MKHVNIGNVTLGNDLPLVIIAGPNTLQSRGHALETACALAEIAAKARVQLIYKTSFDKANRTSLSGARGVGLEAGLPILAEIREVARLPVLTDVHAPEQCAPVAIAIDAIQIPAFLCRQTDLLLAAGAAGKPVLIKKGQFLAPSDMHPRRGQDRGHRQRPNPAVRARQLLRLLQPSRRFPVTSDDGGPGYPVVFDATHSVAFPGGHGDHSAGARAMAPHLARAAVAIGVAAVFIETHQDPDHSGTAEADTMLPLKMMPDLIEELMCFDTLAKAARR
jgi:2-dehydro-3-deoxyphosphooctonate aldolase (KDO 8-P synthase)